ncbi:tyrosine-type recombinase/integrase [Salmonella enterica]|nr:tyrosine-type recombinase/integrase [Salmonella enterica]
MRKYLTDGEWTLLFGSIINGVNVDRDRAMFHLAYRHGLRVSELTNLRYSDVDLCGGSLYVRRLKNGLSTVHPLQADSRSLLQKWFERRHYHLSDGVTSDWLFISRNGMKLSRQRVFMMARKYGKQAGLPFPVHPHMLRHACGYELANQGLDTRLIQDYLGHRNISHTVRYTAGNASRFRRVWRDIPAGEQGRQ